MKLEKFNLQDALNGRPVVTRQLHKVKIAGHNPDAEFNQRLVGWDEAGDALYWDENGRFGRVDDTVIDLFHPAEEKKPRTFWVNEYKSGMGTCLHDSEEEAIKDGKIMTNYITTHKITIP